MSHCLNFKMFLMFSVAWGAGEWWRGRRVAAGGTRHAGVSSEGFSGQVEVHV